MKHNKAQAEAIFSDTKATLVLAGAGTGKTSVIISRIEKVIKDGTLPEQIIATTFTNKAARELRERLSILIGDDALKIYCGTFHKISAQILREHYALIGLESGFQILTEDDQKRLVKRFLKELGKEEKPKVLLDKISKYKETGKKDKEDKLFETILNLYDKALLENNFLDYSDLIKKTVFLFKSYPEIAKNLAKHILIDEYQDINELQYEWIKLLSEHNTLFCVGDEDQSIYAFRGANIKYIQIFDKDFPEANIIKLEENYRSCSQVLKGAVRLISKNNKKFLKNLIASNSELSGYIKVTKVFHEYDEAALVAKKIQEYKEKFPSYNVGILVRTNMQVSYIEHALVEANIPYTISAGKKFYDRKEVQDLVCYLRAINSPSDFLAFSRIINTPKRGIGEAKLTMFLEAMKSLNCDFESALNTLMYQLPRNASEKCKMFFMQIQNWRKLSKISKPIDLLEKILEEIRYIELENIKETKHIDALKEQIKQYDNLPEFLENLQFDGSDSEEESVHLMTMHAAKGLEFDIVLAPGWEENMFPSMLSKTKDDMEEERRLAYVTITRAKYFLEILHATSRRINGRFSNQMPSRFIFEL